MYHLGYIDAGKPMNCSQMNLRRLKNPLKLTSKSDCFKIDTGKVEAVSIFLPFQSGKLKKLTRKKTHRLHVYTEYMWASVIELGLIFKHWQKKTRWFCERNLK